MSVVLRMSALYAPTLKEIPNDADIASHKLLLRAGMMRKTASGVYSYLPLGWRVLRKIEQVVREEMDAIGAQEILMPALQPAELWHESGRWNDYGPELMRLNDRHDREFCLGPTHEELITDLVRNELKSYKQLPLSLYQIQTKYRDEIRPRFGLLRSREFVMKDAYSFHATRESLEQTYDEMSHAYERICERLGLDYRPVEADAGQIGGSLTCEFHALADAGEAELASCTCGYAANTEVAACICEVTEYPSDELTKIATPNVHTIAELAEFLGCPETSTVKAMVGVNDEGQICALFIPGDHELNELKAERACGGFRLATDEELKDAGLPKGSIGCVGLPEGIPVYADVNLKKASVWAIGANEDGYHYVGAMPGRDFEVDMWADLSTAKAGDECPECGGTLEITRGIEVAQVFMLGDKYSRTMGATFNAEDGSEQPFLMGCYGVGISRTLAAIIEQYNDEAGMKWPAAVAPAHVCILPLQMKDEAVVAEAEKIAHELASLGIEVVIDDRNERPGFKFADADLIGWPLQIVVGKRGLENRELELKVRATNEKKTITFDEYAEVIALAKRAEAHTRTFLNHLGVM